MEGENGFNTKRVEIKDHHTIIKEAIATEGMKGTILGMHDYRSNLREYDFILKKYGVAELLESIKTNPLKSFLDYFKEVDKNNLNLRTKIEQDMALYPGIVSEFEELIRTFNAAQSEEEILTAFNALKHFFDSEN